MEFDIVRAWKDARYRQNLTSEQQAVLPENPVGTCELTEADLETVQGSFFGGGAFGSNTVFGDCNISFGARADEDSELNACNTFARIAVNCSQSGEI
jgi:mersacidin/lichenicidin family type 2 lantibiotic